MTQQQRIGRTATTIAGDGNGNTEIVYHSTKVVIFNPERIILNSGGWQSNTTKTRMNQAANTFVLGFGVYQNKFDWFVDFAGSTYRFSDKMTLDRKTGKVYTAQGVEVEPIADKIAGLTGV